MKRNVTDRKPAFARLVVVQAGMMIVMVAWAGMVIGHVVAKVCGYDWP